MFLLQLKGGSYTKWKSSSLSVRNLRTTVLSLLGLLFTEGFSES